MGSGINNKINKFFCNPKNVKKRRNTRREKCYGHVYSHCKETKSFFHIMASVYSGCFERAFENKVVKTLMINFFDRFGHLFELVRFK